MLHDYNHEIKRLGEWLSDPGHAEPCSRFPIEAERGSMAGIYAWHGDGVATELVLRLLGPDVPNPLYLGRVNTPLNTRIVRSHLRKTKASSLRQSLAAMLWDELDLRCVDRNEIDEPSESRLTEWMLEHLSIAVVPIAEKSNVAPIEADVREWLELPLNLNRRMKTGGTRRLSILRRRHLSVSDDLLDELDEMLKIKAADMSDPGIVVPISLATGKGSRRSRARSQTFWTPADTNGGA